MGKGKGETNENEKGNNVYCNDSTDSSWWFTNRFNSC